MNDTAAELPPGEAAGEALDSTAAESELEDELLAAFYAFTYEDAVLVGPSGSSPPPSPHKRGGSPLKRPPSPTRSPTKQEVQPPGQPPPPAAGGPTALQVAGAAEPPLLSREILNALIPPKTWRDENGKWQRVARLTPSSRSEVVRFEALFVQLLEEHQARASAICPVREKFFLQVFEELIRQCACECPERGLLLLRLRDELRMSLQAYQTLYHSSIAYGRQKAVQAEVGIAELENRIQELETERQALLTRRQQLTHRLLQVEAEVAETQQERTRQQQQLVAFLRDQHAQLTTFYGELTHETTWK